MRQRSFISLHVTALVLAATLAAPMSAQARPDATAAVKIPYWSQWTAPDGQTHTTKCYLSKLESKPFSSTPQYIQRLPGDVDSLVYTQLPAGWAGKWHINPKRQWVVVLSGQYYMETSDGKGVTLTAGDVFFGGDQGAKPRPS